MRMLDELKDVLDTIEKDSEWEHKFVTDILIRKEKNPDYKLTGKQFSKLADIHTKYCYRGVYTYK